MPIYEYQCRACGHRLEKLQKISDVPLSDCPTCTKPELQKLVSAAAFRLKGSGWYETDFKNGSRKNVIQGGNESSGDSASDSSGSDSSSDKPSSDSSGSDSSSDKSSSDSKSSDKNSAAKSDVSAAAS